MLKYSLTSNFKLKFEFDIHSVDGRTSTINQEIEIMPLNLYNLCTVVKMYTSRHIISKFQSISCLNRSCGTSPPSSDGLIYVTEQPNKNSEMYVHL